MLVLRLIIGANPLNNPQSIDSLGLGDSLPIQTKMLVSHVYEGQLSPIGLTKDSSQHLAS